MVRLSLAAARETATRKPTKAPMYAEVFAKPIKIFSVPLQRSPHPANSEAAKYEMPRPIATRATLSAHSHEGRFEGDDPATTATTPNDISTFIASDPVSRPARPWSRSASAR